MLFLNRLRANCALHGSKVAIAIAEGETLEEVTYDRLLEETQAVAHWLALQGVRPGDRVAVCLPKGLVALELHLAACSMGAVSLPLNPGYSIPELRYLLEDSGASLLVLPDGPQGPAHPAEAFTGQSARVVRVDPHRPAAFRPRASGRPPRLPADGDQTALMLYTSGTTGRPKGACITHASLTANLDMLHEAWQWSRNDTLLHALPLFHLHGLLVALQGALHAGATCILHGRFDPARILKDLAAGPSTVFMAVPTMYRRILSVLDGGRVDLNHMRLLTSGSDRLPVETFDAIEHAMGHRPVERYGMTETGIMLSNPVDGARVPGQVGVPLPGVEMRVIAPETGAACGTGEVGEFQTRGPHLFSGYWRDEEKTRRSFTRDGWFRTGDLGLRDESGRFELKGRGSDLIISGGLNVYPTEVEQVLAAHGAVAQCAVVGVPDGDWGEAVTAFVVRSDRHAGEAALLSHCRASLAGYKTPKRVVFIDRLPRNAMGKVQKGLLARSA